MRGRRVVPAGGPATRAYTTNQTTTLARLQGLVSAAEPGGGSLEFAFHHVCDPAEACGPDTVTPATLGALIDWLAAARTAGRVDTARPPRPDATAVSVGMLLDRVGSVTLDDIGVVDAAFADLLPNGSLEADADRDGVPDCTQRTVLGTNPARSPAAPTRRIRGCGRRRSR